VESALCLAIDFVDTYCYLTVGGQT